jgi:hypothetical protein
MEAAIATGEFTAPDGRRIFINHARPLIDVAAPAVTMQIAMRDQMIGESVVFGDPVFQEVDGQCSIFADARYMRFRTNIPAGIPWTHAVGVQISRKPSGEF